MPDTFNPEILDTEVGEAERLTHEAAEHLDTLPEAETEDFTLVTMDEVQQAQARLEEDLRDRINRFEEATRLEVRDVYLERLCVTTKEDSSERSILGRLTVDVHMRSYRGK